MTYSFNSGQMLMDVIRFALACTAVAFGYPYLGVVVAMVYITINKRTP